MLRMADGKIASDARDLRLALRLARRELRGGFAGFRIFFLCLMLGAAAIAGVESLSDCFPGRPAGPGPAFCWAAMSRFIWSTGRPAPTNAPSSTAQGTVSEGISMRAMAYARDNQNRQLVELKAVDGRWPLFGAPRFIPAQDLRDALACEDDGICGAAAEQTLLDRLHVKRGDLIKLGNATFRIMGGAGQGARPHLHRLLAGAAAADFCARVCPPPAWSRRKAWWITPIASR